LIIYVSDVLFSGIAISGNAAQRSSRQNIVWLNRKQSGNNNRSLRVNGLFGGGKKDNKEDGQSKVHVFRVHVQ